MTECAVVGQLTAPCLHCCCVGGDEELLFLGLSHTARYFFGEERPKVAFRSPFVVKGQNSVFSVQIGTKGLLDAIHRPGSPYRERFGYYISVALNGEWRSVVVPLCRRGSIDIEFL